MALPHLTDDGLRTMTQIIPSLLRSLGDGSLSITTLASLGELFTSLALQASAERRELIRPTSNVTPWSISAFLNSPIRLDSTVRANSELKAQLDAAKADNFMLTTTNDTLRSRVAALEPEAAAKAPEQAPAKKPGSKPVALSTMPGAKGSADVVDLEVPPLAEDSGK